MRVPRSTFQASPVAPLSWLIADNARTFGVEWVRFHYCENPAGPMLSAFEWSILSRQIGMV